MDVGYISISLNDLTMTEFLISNSIYFVVTKK